MGYNLLRCEGDQSYLMPPSMRDWLSEGHLAWFIVDAVGQMDLREFYAVYRSDGWGAAAYDPGMMVAILLYAYCLGLRSSRRIARALEEDVGFRVVAVTIILPVTEDCDEQGAICTDDGRMLSNELVLTVSGP